LGEAVHRRGRGRHDLRHARGDGRFEHVEGAVDEDVLGDARFFGASRDPNRRLMKDDADAVDGAAHGGRVTHVALDDAHAPARDRRRQVLAAAPREVVEHDDLARACPDELIRDVRADQPGAAGDQHAVERHRGSSSSTARRTRAGLPATTVRAGTSCTTTLPAPTIASSPMSTPHRIVDPEPIDAPRRTRVGTTVQSAAPCRSPPAVIARGYRSLMNVTPWPMNT